MTGIITMEDVIEELIQEEIQDEADTSSQVPPEAKNVTIFNVRL